MPKTTSTRARQPLEAPLTHDAPEQDGSEDPGSALEFNRDPVLPPKENRKPRDGEGRSKQPQAPRAAS